MNRYGSRKFLIRLSIGYLIFLGTVSIFAPFVAPFDPTTQHLDDRFLPPGNPRFVLGTDDFGRDTLSRLIYGSRAALMVGAASISIAFLLGVNLGIIAGISGRKTDYVIMLISDALLSFPTILLALAVVSFLGHGRTQIMLALGIVFTPLFARLARAETLAVTGEEYYEASFVLGTRKIKAVFLHIYPNILGKMIVQASTLFASSIVIEASLSFLGLGAQLPDASWGLMLKEARSYLFKAPWLGILPGIAIGITVLAFNILSDTLSEKANPRIQ